MLMSISVLASLVIILISIISIIFVIFQNHRKFKFVKNQLPPGPSGLPLIGNLHQFATARDLHVYLWKLSEKYGPIMQMRLGSIPILIISSEKLAKQVMKTQDLACCSRPKSLGTRKLSYDRADIIFAPYDDNWREMRKITALHFFSSKKSQSFRPIREDEIFRTVAKISLRLLSSVDDRPIINLSEVCMGFSSSLICRIAFGKRDEGSSSEMRKFDELLHEAQALFAAFYVSDINPCLGWVDRVSGLIRRLETTFWKLDSFYQELIDDHIINRNRKKKKKKETLLSTSDSVDEEQEEEDVLDVLIRLKEEKMCTVDLQWDHIKALLMNIFVAATDTSAASIVWTLTALMKEPKIMNRVQFEIRDLVGGKGRVDEDDLKNLPYLKAVVSESLRLYPPAPLLVPRESIEKCHLDGYEIQPKTLVYINAWAIARDPEYWENPHEFLPERFLNSGIDVKGQDFGVIPFGSGRRICPGMFMGLANVELAVANLLYSFDWECPPGMNPQDIDMDVLPGITMHKKNPLCLVPQKYV